MSANLYEALVGRQDRNTAFAAAFEAAALGLAREISGQADSYRNFTVGALAVVDCVDRLVFLPGANCTPFRGAPKRCAEMDVLYQVDDIALMTDSKPMVRQLYVVGPAGLSITEEVNGLAAPTLHPCGECRDLFAAHPAMTDDTLIITAGLDETSPIERQTLAELSARYQFVQRPASSLVQATMTVQ